MPEDTQCWTGENDKTWVKMFGKLRIIFLGFPNIVITIH